MGMKVCKLVRLTKKSEKGEFEDSKEGKITIRSRVVVSEESVKELSDNMKVTGLLYEVDEAATKKRDEKVEAEVSEAREPKTNAQDATPSIPTVTPSIPTGKPTL